MVILLNSRDLPPSKREEIEKYFRDHFSCAGKCHKLCWEDDESDHVILGFSQSHAGTERMNQVSNDERSAPRVMFKVHERELFKIAGR